MARSACWSYVTWYNEVSGNWATWEPGDLVNLGDVGRFDRDRRFCHSETLADYGVGFSASGGRQLGSRLHVTGSDFQLQLAAAGKAVPGIPMAKLDSAGSITAQKEHACILQLQQVRESHIQNLRDVLVQIAGLLQSGRWKLDAAVVIRRVQVGAGFAAISQGAGQSMTLGVTGSVGLAEALESGRAEVTVSRSRSVTGFSLYEFGKHDTPGFSPPIRVKQSWWGRLLPWRTEGSWLIDPNGRRYNPAKLPPDLSGLPPEARVYSPGHSRMTVDELSGIAVEDLFEAVAFLPYEESSAVASLTSQGGDTHEAGQAVYGLRAVADAGSFLLPAPAAPAPLAAEGPVDETPPLINALSPDGQVRYLLHAKQGGQYWLEVLLKPAADPPVIAALSYMTADGTEQQLLIPIAGSSGLPGSSMVSIEAFAPGMAWRAWPLEPPDHLREWGDDTIRASIRAAATLATAEAWERVLPMVSQDLGELIAREIRAHRRQP